MVSPTLNGVASTIEGSMWLWRASWIRFFSPLTRLSPPVSTILRTAAGLPNSQLLGASASVISEAKKCARPFSSLFNADWSMKCDSSFCVARYDCIRRAYRALLFHAGSAKRRSLGSGTSSDFPFATWPSSFT